MRGLRNHLAKIYNLTYLDPRDAGVALVRQAATLGAKASREFLARQAATLGADVPAVPDLSTISMTLGPLVLLSEASVATLPDEIEATVHEGEHGAQEAEGGLIQTAADYLSAELRARVEADAYAAGLFARYLVTGVPVSEDEAAARLVAGPYHLAAREVEFARSIVRSHVETIRAGLCPPISAAIETQAFLLAADPSSIVPRLR